MKNVFSLFLSLLLLLPLSEHSFASSQAEGYNYACLLMDNGQYYDASEYFCSLGDYKDAEVLFYRCVYNCALEYAQAEDCLSAVTLLNLLITSGYSPASEAVKSLSPLIYEFGVRQYRAGEYSSAFSAFSALPERYEACGDYLFLISMHTCSSMSDEDVSRLATLAGFEDAGSLVFRFNDASCRFLLGWWHNKAGSGSLFFQNLPTGISARCSIPGVCAFSSFEITNGYFFADEIPNFSIEAVSRDEILLTMLSDGSEYMLFHSDS